MNRRSLETPIPHTNHEDPPSVARLIGLIWSFTFSVTSAAILVYLFYQENETYPAFNSYLLSMFPPARGFLVVPEAMLHHAIQAGAAGGKMKIDIPPSSTAYVGRHANEREVGKPILDFIVCKISPATANSFSKTILATFKINRPEYKLTQFRRYPGSVESYRHDKELHSYFLIDHQYLGIRFCQRIPRSMHMRPVVEGTRDNLTTEFYKLTIKHWS